MRPVATGVRLRAAGRSRVYPQPKGGFLYGVYLMWERLARTGFALGYALGYMWARIYPHLWGLGLIGTIIIAGVIYLPRGLSGLGAMVVIVLGGLLIAVVVSNPSRFTGRSSQFLFPFGVVISVLFLSPKNVPSVEFYKAAAQIFPVLLLVFVLEKRDEFHRAPFPEQRIANLLVIGLVIQGEYEALQVLAVDNASRGDASHIYTALAATVTVLLVSLLTPPPTREAPPLDQQEDDDSS